MGRASARGGRVRLLAHGRQRRQQRDRGRAAHQHQQRHRLTPPANGRVSLVGIDEPADQDVCEEEAERSDEPDQAEQRRDSGARSGLPGSRRADIPDSSRTDVPTERYTSSLKVAIGGHWKRNEARRDGGVGTSASALPTTSTSLTSDLAASAQPVPASDSRLTDWATTAIAIPRPRTTTPGCSRGAADSAP